MGGALEMYSHRYDTVISYTGAGKFVKVLVVSTTQRVSKFIVVMEFIVCVLVTLLQLDVLLKIILQKLFW